ncbi:hypothetical protein BKA62DRAFT_694272 [Auriculariales sp. MPI-PUGE-AT-0066]|nr:hypothetical protein BKA62DRAFT_694272 [Auriculariales sp. MPI-PUGE-AT-0066]
MPIINNRITKVAIVGVGGHIGQYIVAALLSAGKVTVTAVTRADSTSTIPPGVQAAVVDYNDPESLSAALRDQDVLIVTLGGRVPQDTHTKLNEAAARAGVPFIVPNQWGGDSTGRNDPDIYKDLPMFAGQPAIQKHISSLGVSSWIGLATGFWYEWSLSFEMGFGFDIGQRKATFFDDGKTRMSVSTFPRVGATIAALLALPVKSEAGTKLSLDDFANKELHTMSFTLTQQDMFESLLRATGDSRESWTVEYQSSKERFEKGKEGFKTGDLPSFGRMLYARGFYPDKETGDREKHFEMVNKTLELPAEDLDAATRAALKFLEEGGAFGRRA